MIDRRAPIGRRASDHPQAMLRAAREVMLMVVAAFGMLAAGGAVDHFVFPPSLPDVPYELPAACNAALAGALNGDCR